jgi:hypothetical protein
MYEATEAGKRVVMSPDLVAQEGSGSVGVSPKAADSRAADTDLNEGAVNLLRIQT